MRDCDLVSCAGIAMLCMSHLQSGRRWYDPCLLESAFSSKTVALLRGSLRAHNDERPSHQAPTRLTAVTPLSFAGVFGRSTAKPEASVASHARQAGVLCTFATNILVLLDEALVNVAKAEVTV